MNPIVIVFSTLGGLFLLFVVRLLSFTSISTEGEMAAATPWWIYVIYLALLFSVIMFVHSLLEEKRKEQKQIEEEGKEVLKMFERHRNSPTAENSDHVEEEWRRYLL
ncbi:sporulation YhaL family protein [Evansella cellulosilytica]|uniref:Uncharacterized protein n=1 Tax=Evansella cellulosilytica (strain ATCC 21833 / DSM 2522 / FERM P-1141 / JCM 9156 / N-4) TaxID=649639 RepID=E6TUH0_EVAC2|nr:sporulation YhaL family protein [Evansella cellulosilytica]ADU29726.1 hypothetical protein Bcell_1463 [Evansella cellulosilytica DSM 2522]